MTSIRGLSDIGTSLELFSFIETNSSSSNRFHAEVARCAAVILDCASFERAINPYLQELKRIRLSWCHVKTFPMTLWQAEDELGFLRIQQFVYAVFFTNVFSLPINSNTNKESILGLKMMINALSVMAHGFMSPRDIYTYFIDRRNTVSLSCCPKFCNTYYSDGVTQF